MKHENPALKEKIITILKTHYAIEPIEITFIPIGEESFSYKVKTTEQTYFIKFRRQKDVSSVNKLLIEIKDLPFIVAPISSNGKTELSLDDGIMSVFPFIDGQILEQSNESFSKEMFEEVMKTMTKIHTFKPQTKLPEEHFKNNYLQQLEDLILIAKDPKVIELLNNHESSIRQKIKRHTEIGENYQKNNPPFVLTHGDITGRNMILTPNGIKLTDWDGAMITPKERDIKFFYDHALFAEEKYLTKTNLEKIDQQLIEYYRQEWALDSILENLRRLNDPESFSDRSELLADIQEYLGI